MKQLEKIYLDWINNFLTISAFAAHYGMTEEFAIDFLNLMRKHNFNKLNKQPKD